MARCDECKANKVCDHDRFGFENCGNFIPVDVVEVVRCKDCIYARGNLISIGICDCLKYRDVRKGDDFCNYGEKKYKEVQTHEN